MNGVVYEIVDSGARSQNPTFPVLLPKPPKKRPKNQNNLLFTQSNISITQIKNTKNGLFILYFHYFWKIGLTSVGPLPVWSSRSVKSWSQRKNNNLIWNQLKCVIYLIFITFSKVVWYPVESFFRVIEVGLRNILRHFKTVSQPKFNCIYRNYSKTS